MQGSLLAQLLHQLVESDLPGRLIKLRGDGRPALTTIPAHVTTKRIGNARLVLASGGVALPRWDMQRCLAKPQGIELPVVHPLVRVSGDRSHFPSAPRRIAICFDCSQSVRLLSPQRQRFALSRVLENLPRQSEFNLLVFNDRRRWCWPRSVATTDANKWLANKRGRQFPSRPATDIHSALRDALATSCHETHLISDGIPDGVPWNAQRTLAALVSRGVNTPIHTWCTSADAQGRLFMRRVSHISGGRAWLIIRGPGNRMLVRKNE